MIGVINSSIRFEDSIRKRIGRPIRFEIRFERKKRFAGPYFWVHVKLFYRIISYHIGDISRWGFIWDPILGEWYHDLNMIWERHGAIVCKRNTCQYLLLFEHNRRYILYLVNTQRRRGLSHVIPLLILAPMCIVKMNEDYATNRLIYKLYLTEVLESLAQCHKTSGHHVVKDAVE